MVNEFTLNPEKRLEAPMRVLLVGDDSNTAQSIDLMLKSEGFIVDSTDLGEDGLEIGKLYDYDIILLDLMLPDIDGYEEIGRAPSELQSLMRISYAVFCLKQKKTIQTQHTKELR